jgi:hypothetical protein
MTTRRVNFNHTSGVNLYTNSLNDNIEFQINKGKLWVGRYADDVDMFHVVDSCGDVMVYGKLDVLGAKCSTTTRLVCKDSIVGGTWLRIVSGGRFGDSVVAPYCGFDHIFRKTAGHPVTFDTNVTFSALIYADMGYFVKGVSAENFNDRTPWFSGDALSELKKVKGKNGKIDHASLPDFMRVVNYKPIDTVWRDTVITCNKNTTFTKYILAINPAVTDTGRNVSNTVSMLILAVQQLSARCDSLEKKVK